MNSTKQTPSSVLSYQNVSKRFDLATDSPKTMVEKLQAAFQPRQPSNDFWAVKDVSFAVGRGESVGITGHNGSGKSTLLKMTAGILRPTSGQIIVQGRIGALIELGVGFHPDLTGRENIYLNASIFGLNRQEVEDRFDDIVEFSELGDFINMPVKHYSSGMYMRLGFSVAVHCDPDVLLVDEVLSVGDQAFQEKCLDRIRELQTRGVTILIVSHQLKAIQTICSSMVVMDKGIIRDQGPVDEVMGRYLEYMSGRNQPPGQKRIFKRFGSRAAEILQVTFTDPMGNPKEIFHSNDPIIVRIEYVAHRPINNPEFGIGIYRKDGVYIHGSNNRITKMPIEQIDGEGVAYYEIDRLSLLAATYEVTVAINSGYLSETYDHHEKAYQFRVSAEKSAAIQGVVDLPARWKNENRADPA